MDARDIRDSNEIDLMDYIRPLIPHWKLLLLVLIIGGVASFLIASTLPKQYRSTAVVYVQQSSGAASLLKNLPIQIGGTGGTSSGYITALLQSDSMRLAIIDRLDLTSNKVVFPDKKPPVEKAVETIRQMISVTESKNGSISIAVTAGDPNLAAEIANTSVDLLGSFVVTASQKKAEFTAERLQETVRDLERAENEMKEFMERYDVASIDEQTRGMISQVSDLEGKLLSMQAELEGLTSQQENAVDLNRLAEGEVQRRSLEASIGVVRKQRDDLRKKLAQLPSISSKYARIQRDIVVLNKTFEILTEQHQLARVVQKGEDGDYQIIDRARPDPKIVAPRRMMIAAGGGLAAFVLAAVFLILTGGRTKTVVHTTRPVTRSTGNGPKVGPTTRV